MTCINCQNRITSTLQQTSGITEASVSYETGAAEITYDPEKISMEQIIARINSLGYSASTQNTSNCNHRSNIFPFAAFGNSEPSGTGKACGQ